MSTAIIGKNPFASALRDKFLAKGVEVTLISESYEEITKFDILLFADDPFTFKDTVTQISTFLKPGQAIIIGNGCIFGTWTVSKALYAAKAPERIIVGMCDAFSGNPEYSDINISDVQVSAHNFVYNQFLSYLCGELFENSVPAASPLALCLSSNTFGYEFSPIAVATKKIELTKKAVFECKQLAKLLGNEHSIADSKVAFNRLDISLHAATYNLYPLCKIADYLSFDAPALNELLITADKLTENAVSKNGKEFLPNPELLFGHEHKN